MHKAPTFTSRGFVITLSLIHILQYILNFINGNINNGCTENEIPNGYGEFGLTKTNPVPVSYTHLDVYKRQGYGLYATAVSTPDTEAAHCPTRFRGTQHWQKHVLELSESRV